MRASYIIAYSLITSGLTELFLLTWQILSFESLSAILEASGSYIMLLACVTVYGGLTSLLLRDKSWMIRLVTVPLVSSFLTTISVVVYPEIGLTGFEWYILFILLFLSGVLAHIVLYGTDARMDRRPEP